MIRVYSMNTCPDCIYLEKQLAGREDFEVIEISSHVHKLKEFIRLRDQSPIFDPLKAEGKLGIPCFVREDGSITLVPEEVGLVSRPQEEVQTEPVFGCGKDGC